jgi:hypothetical protein
MTDHPCKGLPPDAIEAFERIAVNQDPCCGAKPIRLLLYRNLIEVIETREWSRNGRESCMIASYHVPVPIHWQWTTWCAERATDYESEDLGVSIGA